MFNFTRAIVRHTKHNIGKYSLTRVNSYSSAPVSPELKAVSEPQSASPPKTKIIRSSNSIVAAAFASLSTEKTASQSNTGTTTPLTDGKIDSANTIDELLSISSDGTGISRRHALKVVSILASWSSTGKVKLSDFESDTRFIKLCKILTKNGTNKKALSAANRSEDLNMIMNVAADDEAAKLVASITLPQMVKVMQTLATKKRRSTLLLRSLSYNITKSSQKLDLKQSADLLYSMCVLNFLDENLLEKISTDILQGFNTSAKKSSVIGSIITSLGILKYKDESGMLDMLCTWMLENYLSCRTQDLFAMFLTLGVLNHQPANAETLIDQVLPLLTQQDAQKSSIWLDYIWSLVVLNKASREQIDSVLNDDFIAKCDTIPSKIKLLHINGTRNNQERKVPETSEIFKTPITRNREKEEMVNSVLDTLKNLMKSEIYIRSNINTNMGFFIDAECIIDKKCLPVASDKYSQKDGHKKVALMVQDYHDMCRGRVEPTGTIILQQRLLENLGYSVIQVPYLEYRTRDKLIHRVQLIESKLKAIVAETTTSST